MFKWLTKLAGQLASCPLCGESLLGLSASDVMRHVERCERTDEFIEICERADQ